MAFDHLIAERIAVLLDRREIEYGRKHMFGGLAFMIGGKMSICVVGDEIVVRCILERFETLIEELNMREMDFTGRPMKGFVYVEPGGFETESQLDRLVDIADEFGRLGVVGKKKKKS